MVFASASGDFAPRASRSGLLTAAPGATKYLMTLASVANTWIASTGLWEVGTNWSFGHSRTATEDAAIPNCRPADHHRIGRRTERNAR